MDPTPKPGTRPLTCRPVAPSSSSTKKAARLAQKGKGQKLRFQGGALFPFAVALILVLGTGLIAYARQTRPAFDDTAPTEADHWHHVYGFYLCDQWVQFDGTAEGADSNGNPVNSEYVLTGIHSHDDGLMHWHPFSPASIGSRARLGVFLDVYDIELDDDKLQFPEDQRAQLPEAFRETGLFDPGETQCEITDADGNTSMEDADLQVNVWNSIDATDAQTFSAAFDDIPLDEDGKVVTIGFVPNGTDLEKPPWTDTFEEASQNDVNQPEATELFPDVAIDDGEVTVGSVPIEEVPVGSAVAGPDPDGAEPLPAESAPASDEPASSDAADESGG